MPQSSLFEPVAIPEVDLWSFLFERKAKPFTDSKDIFTDGDTDRSYSFGELRSASLAFGQGLQAAWHWQRGDVVAFYTPNSVDTPAATLGVLWAGGIASPANPLYTEAELTFQLRDARAKALVTMLPFLDTARRAAWAVGIPEDRILLVGDERDPAGRVRHFSQLRRPTATATATATATQAQIQSTRGRSKPVSIDARRDLAFLVYSSGTTGLPKGVCLTHYNIVANVLQQSMVDGQFFHPYGGVDGKGDKGLGITPFFHIYGLTCCIMFFAYMGWELVIMQRFDMERACQLIEKYRLTFAFVPPPVVLAFSKHPVVDKYDLTSMRSMNSGAAPLTPELALAVWDRLKIGVKQGYGLSETSPTATVQTPDEWGKFMGSVGKLLPNMEAKIVDPAYNDDNDDNDDDDDGNNNPREVPDGQPGELWLKGPSVFQGYLNRPDETRAATSRCGFFKTGDIFVRDKHGNYYCVDRLKELIKYKGFQVPPAELEGILLGHDDVLDAGVIGVEDRAQATEVPRAYIVLKPGLATDAAKAREIADWLATKTAPHKRLRGGVHFIAEIPKSACGKILRRLLRDRARQDDKAQGAKL
ncbi:phenylacetyl-ligase [Niveomyces insectorum RCEF 264]|uniref:Phenylacetyl-ligase n=1 Tax=Niveomyces insectorum RCEF 264 TaxID=1081102 RepID=A0A167ZAJ3_9HYPO|nr:phenylacetyl-ligase [Niveomyces insectorum RCEF 264]